MSVCLVCWNQARLLCGGELEVERTNDGRTAVERAIVRIAHQIVEKNHGTDLCIIGIKSKGYPIAKIADAIYKIEE